MAEKAACISDANQTVVKIERVDFRLEGKLVVCVKAADGEGGSWTLYRCGPPVGAEDLYIVKCRCAGTASAELNPNDMNARCVDNGHHRWVRLGIGTGNAFVA